MGWKAKLQLLDMDPDQRIECRCKTCRYVWYERPSKHLSHAYRRQLYLDEFESRLSCQQWACKGNIAISLNNESETEGFQGGLA